jgi:hypothetical protein
MLSGMSILAQDTPDSVSVDAAETTAYFTWPTDEAAQSYQIDIYRSGEVFCRLTLGDKGQLLGISFSAPERKSGHELAETFSFLVTGLDAATRYNFVLSALDADGKPLHVYIGDFATTGYSGLTRGGGDEVIPTPPIIPTNPELNTDVLNVSVGSTGRSKRYESGRIVIIKGRDRYSLQGKKL